MSVELNELFHTVSSNIDIDDNDHNDPQVGFYAKYVTKLEDVEPITNDKSCENDFKNALEFQKYLEGKRPNGCCIIWGCTKKTTRKCKCGCLQFVCKECCLCVV